MAKNAARAAIPAPVVTPASTPGNVQPAASAANVTHAAGNGASSGAPVIATGPQAPVGQDPGVASQNRVDSARAKLISEASKTIKIDVNKSPEPKTHDAASHMAPAKSVETPAAADAGQAAKPAPGSTEEQLAKAVAQVARLNRQLREGKQAAKPAEAAAPPPELAALAGKMKALEAAAKSDPYAVFQALEAAGMPYQTLLETFVSQKPGERPTKATTTEANAALDALKADFEAYKASAEKEKTDAQKRAEAAEQQASRESLVLATKTLIEGSPKRWELVAKEPAAIPAAVAEARKLVASLGRDVTEEEGQEIMETALDALEEHYGELGQRYSKAPPAAPARRFAATKDEGELPEACCGPGSALRGNHQSRYVGQPAGRRQRLEQAHDCRGGATGGC